MKLDPKDDKSFQLALKGILEGVVLSPPEAVEPSHTTVDIVLPSEANGMFPDDTPTSSAPQGDSSYRTRKAAAMADFPNLDLTPFDLVKFLAERRALFFQVCLAGTSPEEERVRALAVLNEIRNTPAAQQFLSLNPQFFERIDLALCQVINSARKLSAPA